MSVLLQLFKNKYFRVFQFLLLVFCVSNYSYGQRVNFTSAAQTVSEQAIGTDCGSSTIISVGIAAIQVDTPTTITFNLDGSTATQGEDYNISQNTLMVEGTMSYNIDLEIIDDAIVEDDETIAIAFTFNDVVSMTLITITNDDAIPVLGNEPITLLTETFDVSTIPEGWSASQSLSSGLNIWKFNGTGLAAGTAYISFGDMTTPVYDPIGANAAEMDASSNALLLTPVINGQGLGAATISFDWMAGGETDPMAEGDAALFDYGTFLYSINGGVSFIPVENFVGSAGAGAQSGTFSMEIPELENQTFQLAFRWINDPLISTAFSFTVDNLEVVAPPVDVETMAEGSDQESVRAGNDIFFLSDENNNIIARIENASQDLGCVEMVVTSGGSSDLVLNESQQFNRATKVIEIIANDGDNTNATYDVTLYFTPEEVAGFANVNDIQLLKVSNTNIDATTDSNFVLSGGLFQDSSANGFLSFKGNFTGFSTFSIAEPAVTQGVNEFNLSKVRIYPNSVLSGELLTITSSNAQLIERIQIYTLSGQVVKTENFTPTNSLQLPTGSLASGVYFIKINGNSKNSSKLIVR